MLQDRGLRSSLYDLHINILQYNLNPIWIMKASMAFCVWGLWWFCKGFGGLGLSVYGPGFRIVQQNRKNLRMLSRPEPQRASHVCFASALFRV